MIPPLEHFVAACGFLARRFDWELSPRDARLIEALAECRQEAVELARKPEDEPAAIFHAFSRILHRFGDDYVALPIMVALNRAMALGLEPRATRYELVDWARGISAGLLEYDAVRAWFEERLVRRRH